MSMKALEKRIIPRMNQTAVTFLGFGGLEIGRDWGMGNDTRRPCERTAGEVLHTALDLGINLIDTASAYHRSEERIGKAVSDRRASFVLATKCGEHSSEPTTYYDFSYQAVLDSIDRSLRLLKTDVIDLLQIHFGPNPADVLDKGETVAAMQEAQKQGKVRFIGASIDGDLARRCIECGDFDVMQMAYNLNDHGNRDNIRLCRQKGMGVLVRCGLGNGLFTPRALANLDALHPATRDKLLRALELCGGISEAGMQTLMALDLRFLYETEGVSSVIIGTKKPENLRRNIELIETQTDDGLFTAVKSVFGINE